VETQKVIHNKECPFYQKNDLSTKLSTLSTKYKQLFNLDLLHNKRINVLLIYPKFDKLQY